MEENTLSVLKMGGKHYMTGPVILARTNMDGEVISLTIDEEIGRASCRERVSFGV